MIGKEIQMSLLGIFNKIKKVSEDNKNNEDNEGKEIQETGEKLFFDYNAFENELYEEVCHFMKSHSDRKDIYAFSIKYEPEFTTFIGVVFNSMSNLETKSNDGMEDYYYYKYCEEEWEGGEIIGSLSEQLKQHYEAIEEWAADDDFIENQTQSEHRDKIIEVCIKVMQRVKESEEYAMYSKLNLNVFVREFFTTEEVVGTYKKFNDDEALSDLKKYLGVE